MPSCKACAKFDAIRGICSVPEGSPIRKCVIALLEEECRSYRGAVLEIGCGGWSYAKDLLEKAGCTWDGIDPLVVDSKKRVSIATRQGTVGAIPFSNESFDAVLGVQTMEHWAEFNTTYKRAFYEINRVLKKGGMLSLNVPIHFHGDTPFVRGDLDEIRSLFDPSAWEITKFEEWRRDHQPLASFPGWRKCGFTDEQANFPESSYILQIHARKIGNLKKPLFEWMNKQPPPPKPAARAESGDHTERMEPDTRKWRLHLAEHLVRYRFAGKFAGGAKALDVACGTGYGAHDLATRGAASVHAVDISEAALATASQHFLAANLTFSADDATVLASASPGYDVIVAFEVFEHLDLPGKMLERCAALLAKEGHFFCSTPNTLFRPKQADGKTPRNPFHVREYDLAEFREILARHFRIVTIYGQRVDPRAARIQEAFAELEKQVVSHLLALRANPLVRLGFLAQRLLGRNVLTLPQREFCFSLGIEDYIIDSNDVGNATVFVAHCQDPILS